MVSILNTLVGNWWALALRGLFGLLFGILAFMWPGITLQVLVLLFGAYALVDGIFAIIAALAGRTEGIPWWALLLEGIVGIGAGIVTLFWPGITAFVLLIMIAAWAIVTGIFEIAAAVRLRKEIEGEWILAVSGVVSLLFGILLLVNPLAGALALVWMIAAYQIIFGILLIALGFKLRSLLHGSRPLAA